MAAYPARRAPVWSSRGAPSRAQRRCGAAHVREGGSRQDAISCGSARRARTPPHPLPPRPPVRSHGSSLRLTTTFCRLVSISLAKSPKPRFFLGAAFAGTSAAAASAAFPFFPFLPSFFALDGGGDFAGGGALTGLGKVGGAGRRLRRRRRLLLAARAALGRQHVVGAEQAERGVRRHEVLHRLDRRRHPAQLHDHGTRGAAEQHQEQREDGQEGGARGGRGGLLARCCGCRRRRSPAARRRGTGLRRSRAAADRGCCWRLRSAAAAAGCDLTEGERRGDFAELRLAGSGAALFDGLLLDRGIALSRAHATQMRRTEGAGGASAIQCRASIGGGTPLACGRHHRRLPSHLARPCFGLSVKRRGENAVFVWRRVLLVSTHGCTPVFKTYGIRIYHSWFFDDAIVVGEVGDGRVGGRGRARLAEPSKLVELPRPALGGDVLRLVGRGAPATINLQVGPTGRPIVLHINPGVQGRGRVGGTAMRQLLADGVRRKQLAGIHSSAPPAIGCTTRRIAGRTRLWC